MENYEEKYKQALERCKKEFDFNNLAYSHEQLSKKLEHIFPELKKNEDERIKTNIIKLLRFVRDTHHQYFDECNEAINWLGELGVHKGYIDDIYNAYRKFQSEKSSESEDNEDLNILQRFSFYSYKDEPKILYLAGLYVNDKHRNKGIGTKILKIANEVAMSIGCNIIRLKTQKDTDAERFYRKNGYTILTEEGNQVWLEKQREQKQISITEEWIENYWQHEKVNNPNSYDNGDEIQFDHDGFIRFCKDIANRQKQQTINKARKWLKENIYHRVYKCNDDLGFPTATFLAEFKKAMEESNK